MKKLKIISILTFILFTFTGCLSKTELEDYAYVIAVGVDKGSEDNYLVTFQIAVPIKIAGEGSTGGGKESTSLVTLETDTLFNSISRADTMISKEITLSHNKIIVISEEVAKEGVQPLLNAFVTNREIRPKTSVLVYRGLAKELLANLEPILEKNPSRYYDLLLDSNQYTGYTIDNTLFNFYLASKDTLSSPYALLTEPVREEESSIEIPSRSKNNPDSIPHKRNSPSGDSTSGETIKQANSDDKNLANESSTNLESNNNQNNNSSTNSGSGNNIQNNQIEVKNATGESQNNQTPETSQNEENQNKNQQNQDSQNQSSQSEDSQDKNSQSQDSQSQNLESSSSSSNSSETPKTANVAGIAIFANDKLVGEIKNEQILSHVILLGKLKKVNIDIEDIKDKTKTTVIKVRQTESPQINVKINNNTPKIDILIRLECDLITSGSQIDYTDEKNQHKLSETIKDKLTHDMNIYLTKISKDFKADPIGFGKHYRMKVLTLDDINDLEWKKIFPNSEFNIEFQLHLDTTQMVSNQVS